MNELNRYFERINTGVTPSELTEKVIGTDKVLKKRRRPCRLMGIIAAAAAVMTLSISVAASGIGYFDIFSFIFGEKAENLSGSIVEEAEIIRNDTERMDFELVAAAADKHGVFVILEVTAKNGFKLGENHIGDARADFWYKLNPEPDSSGNGNMYMIEGDENKARIALRRTCDEDITGREIILTVGEYQDYPFSQESDKQWEAKFTAVDNSIEYEVDGMKICISPIHVTLDGETQLITSYSMLKIITENDTVTYNQVGITKEFSANGTYEQFAAFTIGEPINPEDVIALEVDHRRYDLK